MGTEGMKASLISRELIADSLELCVVGYAFDAAVIIVGCDKTMPAAAMALARLNVPGVVLYSGSIAPGRYKGRDLTIQDVFEAVGQHAAGAITEEELTAIEEAACPGAGRMRRPVHRQHDGDGAGVPGAVAAGHGDRGGDRPAQAGSGPASGRVGDGRAGAQRPPPRHPDAGGVGERHRLHRLNGRVDQRGAPSAGDRGGGGRRVEHRRLRPDQRKDAIDR